MCIVHEIEKSGASQFGCAQGGCRDCQDSLVRQHERLVHYVVRRQARGNLSYEDVAQAGRIGLWKAVLHYDEKRGLAFSTYAYVAIERAVWRAVKQSGHPHGWVEWSAKVSVVELAEEGVWWEQVEAALREAVQGLPERMRHVMVRVYGLDGQAPLSLAELGRRQGVSREAMRYWHNQAVVLLRLPLFSDKLRRAYDRESRAAVVHMQRLTREWQRRRRAG